jgi:hypothetical protein
MTYQEIIMPKQRAIHLWIGLPIATAIGSEASATQKAVQEFLSGMHRWSADDVEQVCEIASVTTACQPVGAMFDYLLTDQGEMPPDRKVIFKAKEIGIVGIGMNTVDLLVVAQGAPVERFTAGENIGVRRLLELTNGSGLYSLAERDDQLRTGTLDVSTAQSIWEREVLGLIEQKWGTLFRRFAVIVVVGGGALLMREALLRRFGGKAIIPDDPVISTDRGLYKFALMKAAKSDNTAETLAFDAGFGSIKLFGKQGRLLLQSAVAINGTTSLGKLVGLKTVHRPLHIQNERGSFYVGQGAHSFGRPVQNLDFDRLTGSPEMLALFHGALTQYFQALIGK